MPYNLLEVNDILVNLEKILDFFGILMAALIAFLWDVGLVALSMKEAGNVFLLVC